MNNEFTLTSKYLELKRILKGISDISYSFDRLNKATMNQNVPIGQQVSSLEQLVNEAKKLLEAQQ